MLIRLTAGPVIRRNLLLSRLLLSAHCRFADTPQVRTHADTPITSLLSYLRAQKLGCNLILVIFGALSVHLPAS